MICLNLGLWIFDQDSGRHWYVLLAGLMLIIVGMMLSLRNRRLRQNQAITPREQIERMNQARGLRGDLEQLMVEVEQLAKRFATQLDAKSIELQRLIREADQRLEQLNALNEQPSRDDEPAKDQAAANDPPPAQPASSHASPSTPQSAHDALTQQVYALADDGHGSRDIARKLNEHVGKVELILALRNA